MRTRQSLPIRLPYEFATGVNSRVTTATYATRPRWFKARPWVAGLLAIYCTTPAAAGSSDIWATSLAGVPATPDGEIGPCCGLAASGLGSSAELALSGEPGTTTPAAARLLWVSSWFCSCGDGAVNAPDGLCACACGPTVTKAPRITPARANHRSENAALRCLSIEILLQRQLARRLSDARSIHKMFPPRAKRESQNPWHTSTGTWCWPPDRR